MILQNQSCKNLYKADIVLKKRKRTMFILLERENVFIHVKISYIQNKSLWLLSVALLVESWLRSFSCKISGGVFSTVDQISVTKFCHFANTHFPSKCVWEWEGSTLSLLSQCLANIRNWRLAKINSVQGKKHWRRSPASSLCNIELGSRTCPLTATRNVLWS